jgi:hypothetical membrane protein
MRDLLSRHRTDVIRIAGICGVLLPVVIFSCLGLSIVSSPWFTWTEHALSDLGIQQHTAAVFNNGMIIGGVLTCIFSLGLIAILSNKTGPYLLLGSSFALIGIGIFPETVSALHFFTSASFFVILTLALLVMGITSKQNHFERSIGLLALLFALIAIGSSVLLLEEKGVALAEAFSCFPAFVWCLIVGTKMTRLGT